MALTPWLIPVATLLEGRRVRGRWYGARGSLCVGTVYASGKALCKWGRSPRLGTSVNGNALRKLEVSLLKETLSTHKPSPRTNPLHKYGRKTSEPQNKRLHFSPKISRKYAFITSGLSRAELINQSINQVFQPRDTGNFIIM